MVDCRSNEEERSFDRKRLANNKHKRKLAAES